MYEFIPSEYYRNFCRKNKIVFSDREHATMLWDNSSLPLEKKISELEKIASETDDGELKDVIEAWAAYKIKSLETANNPRKGEELYLVSTSLYGEAVEARVFDCFESAQKFIASFCGDKTGYMITKVKISDENAAAVGAEYECVVQFDRSGEIIDAWSYKSFSLGNVGYDFIPFENPFERGDIVRDCRSGEIGVVETSQEEWKDFLKRNENNKAYDFSDAALIVQFLDEDSFIHEHIQPIYLEKLQLNKKGIPECLDTKNNIKDDLITCVSELMRGEIQLDIFMSIFLEWREERIYKQVKSSSWRR